MPMGANPTGPLAERMTRMRRQEPAVRRDARAAD